MIEVIRMGSGEIVSFTGTDEEMLGGRLRRNKKIVLKMVDIQC